jgi:hypothetical protein
MRLGVLSPASLFSFAYSMLGRDSFQKPVIHVHNRSPDFHALHKSSSRFVSLAYSMEE